MEKTEAKGKKPDSKDHIYILNDSFYVKCPE